MFVQLVLIFAEVKATVAGESLAAEELTIAEVLSDSGYNSVHIGKWHISKKGIPIIKALTMRPFLFVPSRTIT